MTSKILTLCFKTTHKPASSFWAMWKLSILHLFLNSCFYYKVTMSDTGSLTEGDAF